MAIATDNWTPDAERPGYLRCAGPRNAREVLTEVREYLQRQPSRLGNGSSLLEQLEYLDLSPALEYGRGQAAGTIVFPACRWVAVYAVRGSSEGYYIHVDALSCPSDGAEWWQARNVFLGKTFDGDAAKDVVAALTFVLQAPG